MPDITEKNFESTIEQVLLSGGPDALPEQVANIGEIQAIYDTDPGPTFTPGGFRKRTSADYDEDLCLDPEMVVTFLQATQPREWAKLRKQYGDRTRKRFIRRLAKEIEHKGTLYVLRNGIKDMGAKFDLVYFKPQTGLNPELQEKYRANQFSVIRQWEYSVKDGDKQHRKSIDLGIFINGLPIFTAELKNPLTGQNYHNAIHQYKTARSDAGEPLFDFGRCLAHFAVDPDEVHFATEIAGEKTRFFPFNQGRGRGAGNPVPNHDRFATAYLWEQIWAKDSILDLLQHFIHIIEERDERGKKTGEKMMVFPRYHQLDAARKLLSNTYREGPGEQYLIQHSAGSGKTFTISWLAHQLAKLHDEGDQPIFDSVIVITDRRVLDDQLQEHVQQFERTRGLVAPIDKRSDQLRQALERGKQIIVTTLHKFSYIYEEIGELPGEHFALIIDEAHSSQTGEMKKHLKDVLSVDNLEEAEALDDVEIEDWEDRIVREMRTRGRLTNLSTYAFTATPKAKTLELFGTKQEDGSYRPFHLYSMRQAIDEGFILDVLENYTTYKSYWRLLKKIEGNPRYEKKKAAALLREAVERSPEAIEQKVAVMVEDFHARVAHHIKGRAKAMILTRSRLHAVRYRQILDRYLKERGYPYQAMVAFSGTVKDPETGKTYTERSMNGGIPQSQTTREYHRDKNRFMVVANKFQTGFDEPLLTAMYVDKRLGGVRAVQSLSRLNRTHPDKKTTFVLDFANEAENIQAAFSDYYDTTILSEGTDPNILYDLQNKLEDTFIYTKDEVDTFARIWFEAREEGELDTRHPQLHNALQPAVDRYRDSSEEEQETFRGLLKKYVRTYAFLSQMLPFVDPELEKLYLFAYRLRRVLPYEKDTLPQEIIDQVEVAGYDIRETHSGGIEIKGKGELKPPKGSGGRSVEDELASLSEIVALLNEQYGVDIPAEEGEDFMETLLNRLEKEEALRQSVEVNPPEDAKLTFQEVINDVMNDMLDVNFKMYKMYIEDQHFSETIRDWMFAKYMEER